jgi:hypothetical protein
VHEWLGNERKNGWLSKSASIHALCKRSKRGS